MKIFRLLALFALVPGLAFGQARVSTPPTSAGSQILPNGAANPYSLGQLNSPTNYAVPRGHLRVWKPYAGTQSIDNTGSFFNGLTAAITLEVDDDVTMVQPVLANFGASSYTLTNAAVWGSSQWETLAQQVNPAGGITAYDGNGSALTSMALLSFGNNGLDSAPTFGTSATAPANAASLVTLGSSSGTTINVAQDSLCPALGSTIFIVGSTASVNPPYIPNTTVTACNSGAGTITVSQTLLATIPTVTTVYFLYPSFTVPGSTNLPLPNLVYADWTPITTYVRRDGPIMAGMKVLQSGVPLSGTVSSVASTSVQMSGNLASDIPAGTALQACWPGVTNGTITPNYSVQFATATAFATNIAAGMTVYSSTTATPSLLWPIDGITVASVSSGGGNTTAVLSSPLPTNGSAPNYGSGATFSFVKAQVTTAQTNSGSAVLTLDDVSKLATGMSVYQGSGAGSIPGTITSIDTNAKTVTMTLNTTANVPAGQTIRFYFTIVSNATATASVAIPLSPAIGGVIPGMSIVGASYPTGSYAWNWSSSNVLTTLPPTSVVSSGTTVYFCNSITTSTVSTAGQPQINFAQTNWPRKLITLRINIGSTNANFWNTDTPPLALWRNIAGGGPLFTGVKCSSEGVLNIAGISNTTGSCTQSGAFPVYMIKMYGPRRGVTIACVGDSHCGGDTTITNSSNYVVHSAYRLNNSNTLPISPLNLGWSGKTSMAYGTLGMQVIRSVQPEIVFIHYTTSNDSNSILPSIAGMSATANAIASYVRSYGGLPIMVPDYQRQTFGCDVNTAANETVRLNGETLLNSAALAGAITVDLPTYLADPVNGANWFNPLYSNECVHANDNGQDALAISGVLPTLKPLLRY